MCRPHAEVRSTDEGWGLFVNIIMELDYYDQGSLGWDAEGWEEFYDQKPNDSASSRGWHRDDLYDREICRGRKK